MSIYKGPGKQGLFGGRAVSPPAATVFSKAHAPKRALRMATILVVDDDPSNVELYCRIICSIGQDFRKAGDGIEALEIYRRGGIDLVLSDFQMPGMGGLELLRRIRAQNPDARVIIVTGGANRAEEAELLRSGAAIFLKKPVSVPVLIGAIKANL